MNLEDLLDQKGLQQSEWSLTAPAFGCEGQLKIVGWSGQTNAGNGNKIYIVKCSVCEKDSELFGEGYFKTSKGHLEEGKIPCGCSSGAKFNKDQWLIRIERVCSEAGFTLVSHEDFKGGSTRAIFSCPVHGQTGSKTFRDFFNGGRRCIECRRDGVKKSLTLPDEDHISKFMSTGSYPIGSKFERSFLSVPHERYRDGVRPYWKFTCSVCEEVHERYIGDFKSGKIPCSCGHYKQTVAYINLIKDNNLPIAIKFGITRSVEHRAIKQDRLSAFTVSTFLAYSFKDTASCKAAEKECKETMFCGLLTKMEMPDGYTETTYVYNLDKIKQIYIKHGGVEI